MGHLRSGGFAFHPLDVDQNGDGDFGGGVAEVGELAPDVGEAAGAAWVDLGTPTRVLGRCRRSVIGEVRRSW